MDILYHLAQAYIACANSIAQRASEHDPKLAARYAQLRLVLRGGEDHALAATFPAGTPLPEGWQEVGLVSAGAGVTVDGAVPEGDGGHRHYR